MAYHGHSLHSFAHHTYGQSRDLYRGWHVRNAARRYYPEAERSESQFGQHEQRRRTYGHPSQGRRTRVAHPDDAPHIKRGKKAHREATHHDTSSNNDLFNVRYSWFDHPDAVKNVKKHMAEYIKSNRHDFDSNIFSDTALEKFINNETKFVKGHIKGLMRDILFSDKISSAVRDIWNQIGIDCLDRFDRPAYGPVTLGKPMPSAYNPINVSKEAGFGFRFGHFKNGVKGLIIHHTSGTNHDTLNGVISTYRERHLPAQYVMDRNGVVYRTLPEDARGQHLRPGQGFGKGHGNHDLEGIEVIAHDDASWTQAQLHSMARFVLHHAEKYGYDPMKTVWGHGQVNGHKESDEGMYFVDWFRKNYQELHAQYAAEKHGTKNGLVAAVTPETEQLARSAKEQVARTVATEAERNRERPIEDRSFARFAGMKAETGTSSTVPADKLGQAAETPKSSTDSAKLKPSGSQTPFAPPHYVANQL